VHGTISCWPISIINDEQYNCGDAGELFWITRNAFQYSAGLDFKLRGKPSDGAYVYDNVFPHADLDDSVWTAHEGLHTADNTQGKDTFGVYGSCDFDADGKDDLFLATGRTWWFSSGGAFHWTYLNNKREELAQVGLGDFDHDGRCDVLTVNAQTGRWELSSAGTSDFVPLPTGFVGPLSQLRFGDFNGDGYTDIFQRWKDGQWFAYTFPMSQGPVPLQSSSKPIESLRFGDFDGDRVTDVLAISSGVWSWSRSGLATWRPLNSRYTSLDGILAIANVDGLPGDDVIRLASASLNGGQLQVSSAGRGAWSNLAPMSWPSHPDPITAVPTPYVPFLFAGTFVSATTDSLLQLDSKDRFTTQFSAGQPWFLPHSLYAH
jgi:hypothetical protein